MKAEFTIGAFGIIFDNKKRVLLCHRKDHDLWNLPGGALEVGESVTDCAIREIKEETGLNAEILRLVGVYNKKEKNDLVFSFVCKIVSGEITLNDEADKIEWFDLEKLPSNTIPKQVERIMDAMENSEKTIFKIQTGKSSI
jgi:8-oxo-dGTP diphosphatase